MKLTWRSYFSHLGAILGMASFSCSLRWGTPVSCMGSPSRIEVSNSGSTFSWRLTVFSVGVTLDMWLVLTDLGLVSNSKELGLVITCNSWVSVRVSWEEGQLFGHIVGLHLVLLYDLVFRMRLCFVLLDKLQRINLL